MTQGEFSVTIAAPPETVWPWISQLEKHVEWSPKAYSVEWISGEPNSVGSRFRSVGWIPGNKNNVNEGEITEVIPNQRLALRADDKQGSFQNTYVLKPSGDGTEVTYTLVFPQMKGVMAAMVPVAFTMFGKPDIRKRMAKLKEAVEAPA
jgi:uncharacterized protein YndB with AHSA1/START domain